MCCRTPAAILRGRLHPLHQRVRPRRPREAVGEPRAAGRRREALAAPLWGPRQAALREPPREVAAAVPVPQLSLRALSLPAAAARVRRADPRPSATAAP